MSGKVVASSKNLTGKSTLGLVDTKALSSAFNEEVPAPQVPSRAKLSNNQLRRMVNQQSGVIWALLQIHSRVDEAIKLLKKILIGLGSVLALLGGGVVLL